MKYNFEPSERAPKKNEPFIMLNYAETSVHGYGHFDSYICHLESNRDGTQSLTTYSDYEGYNNFTDECLLSGLKVYAQRNLEGDLTRITNDNKPYAIGLVYDNTKIETSSITKAEKKIAFLRRFGKGMEKLVEEFGYPADFGQWLIYASKVLNVKIGVANNNYPAGVRFLRNDEVKSQVEYMMTRRHQKEG